MKVVQEFFCNDCDGYSRITLDKAINMSVKIECPNCGRQHERHIENGLIYDKTMKSANWNIASIIIPMKSTYSKTAVLKKSQFGMRDGLPLGDPAKDLIQERWNEIYGDRI
jgi:hypothetical protein